MVRVGAGAETHPAADAHTDVRDLGASRWDSTRVVARVSCPEDAPNCLVIFHHGQREDRVRLLRRSA